MNSLVQVITFLLEEKEEKEHIVKKIIGVLIDAVSGLISFLF